MSDPSGNQDRVDWWPAAWEGSVPIDELVDVVTRHPVLPPDTVERLFGSQDRLDDHGSEIDGEFAQVTLVLPERAYGVLTCYPSSEADDRVSVTIVAASLDCPEGHGWYGLRPLVDELGLASWDAEPPPDDIGVRDLFLKHVVEAWDGWHVALPSDTASIEAVLRSAMATLLPRPSQDERKVIAYIPSPGCRLTLYGRDVTLVVPAKRLALGIFGSDPPRITGWTGWVVWAWAQLFPLSPQRTELVVGACERSLGEACRRFVESRWPDATRLDALDEIWDTVLKSHCQAQAPSHSGAFSDPAVLSVLERLSGKKREVATAALKGQNARAIFEELGGAICRETIQVYCWEFRTKEQYQAFWPYLSSPHESYSRWGRQAHS